MSDRKPHSFLMRLEQLTLAIMLMGGIVSISGYWFWRGAVGGRLIEIDGSTPLSAQYQVDVNEAQWPELAQLPGIGETMARRIVDERIARGQFSDHEDLRRRVHGVGPRTLERIRPYLIPMPDMRNVVESESRTGVSGS